MGLKYPTDPVPQPSFFTTKELLSGVVMALSLITYRIKGESVGAVVFCWRQRLKGPFPKRSLSSRAALCSLQ